MECAIYRLPLRSMSTGKEKGGGTGERRKRKGKEKGEKKKGENKEGGKERRRMFQGCAIYSCLFGVWLALHVLHSVLVDFLGIPPFQSAVF